MEEGLEKTTQKIRLDNHNHRLKIKETLNGATMIERDQYEKY
jgi:hypothetical protein